MCSPVSRRAIGECNAITSLGFGHNGLTFAGTLEIRAELSLNPFLDRQTKR